MSDKTKAKEFFAKYDRQIRKDMEFWINYRPSRWGDFLPEKSLKPLIKFIKSKSGKKFFLYQLLSLAYYLFKLFKLKVLFCQTFSDYG